MVLEGPLIHHLEVSKQGFELAVLPVPFGMIQTRYCITNPSAGNQRFCNYVYMYMSALLCNIYA